MDYLTDPFLVDPQYFDGPVLVTGAGGCIGAWVVAILTRSGVPVVAMDLTDDRRRPALLLGDDLVASLVWETGDIGDGDVLEATVARHGVRAIVHMAGLQVPFCKANPAAGARVNVEGTVNVLQAARAANIKRTVYTSSVAAYGMPPDGAYLATLYGVYKKANEWTAAVYWQDWEVPSIGIRPNVVYGVCRDQGMSSKGTVAIHAAAAGVAYEVPFAGRVSWLYAGEAAAAMIACVSADQSGAPVFDLNGTCERVETGLDLLRGLVPEAKVSCTGTEFPFPPDLDDGPLRAHVGEYPSVSLKDGIAQTYRAFKELVAQGRMDPALIA
ncbi:MAG: SDR family oxidoreductase [Pseudomonadota bacterium]